MKKILSDKRAIAVFLLPAALVYAIFAIYPVIMSGYYSLLDWNGVGDAKFIGLSNQLCKPFCRQQRWLRQRAAQLVHSRFFVGVRSVDFIPGSGVGNHIP